MDYWKHYINLIERAKNENRKKLKKDNSNFVYYEKQHIRPRCMNGKDIEKNLVLLTGREHFIAHQLLYKKFKNTKYGFKLLYALHAMSNQCNGKQVRNNKEYHWIKKKLSEKISENKKGKNNPMYGKKQSKETIEKRSNTIKQKYKNKNHPNLGTRRNIKTKNKMSNLAKNQKWINNNIKMKHVKKEKLNFYLNNGWKLGQLPLSKEKQKIKKEKISKANKGRKWSLKSKKKFSENRKGKNNPFYGKKHSKKSIEKRIKKYKETIKKRKIKWISYIKNKFTKEQIKQVIYNFKYKKNKKYKFIISSKDIRKIIILYNDYINKINNK